ncbi:hypothetical protein [Parafilimonas terrae]|uniref:Uncharacterized protein n=1 Tax=Parafilimonas terrae TaxID=1465490 RepID=A0A1I5YPV6_9BACT|nr:hypothetical protein [Parafilimonas terrae]SFQ46243.1 hypothetical protein SAMN05444277_11397 [Parafilimonas terrae]
MKKILVSLLAAVCFVNVHAQSAGDSSMHATAVAVCDCLGKSNLTDSSSAQELQQAFLSCITSSPDFLTKMMAGGDMDDAEKMATDLAMELMKINCPTFMKMAMAMAANGDGNELNFSLPSTPQVKTEKAESAEGTIVNVEEKDFLYITLKTAAGRELNFIYYTYVPGSDDWLKDPVAKLKNKNVSLSYVNTEVYQPKFKQFMNVKQIKTLTIQ